MLALTGLSHAAPSAGQAYFENNCSMCHTVKPNMEALLGPGLFNVVGRKVGSAPGFNYSSALADLGAACRLEFVADLSRPRRFARQPADRPAQARP